MHAVTGLLAVVGSLCVMLALVLAIRDVVHAVRSNAPLEKS